MDAQLRSYATARELDYIEAIEKHGSHRKAAKALGVHSSAVDGAMKALKKRAALNGYAPEHGLTKPVPEGFSVKRRSAHYTKGLLDQEWVIAEPDAAQREQMLREFAEALAEGVKGMAPSIPAPKSANEDLMCVIPIGDPHFGLRSWQPESGGHFDLDIAERLTCGAMDRLIESAPPAKTAVLLNLGDHFHADSQSNTTTSGTPVDVDGRWAKIQQVGLRAMLYCINRLLERHEQVVVRINRGNHDKHSAYALSLMISCYFHNEPRVQVDLSPAAVWYMHFGNVLIGSTHGDTIKGDKLVGVMAADRPQEWGASKHRYWFVGHLHHSDIKEYPGGIVEYLRTLAPGDAWHHGQGYRSGRDMRLVVMHREHGEIERHRVDVGMLS